MSRGRPSGIPVAVMRAAGRRMMTTRSRAKCSSVCYEQHAFGRAPPGRAADCHDLARLARRRPTASSIKDLRVDDHTCTRRRACASAVEHMRIAIAEAADTDAAEQLRAFSRRRALGVPVFQADRPFSKRSSTESDSA